VDALAENRVGAPDDSALPRPTPPHAFFDLPMVPMKSIAIKSPGWNYENTI
jgi:hypothetical protein